MTYEEKIKKGGGKLSNYCQAFFGSAARKLVSSEVHQV